jgi:excisionase family DNA binding protein
MKNDEVLTLREAAELLKVSKRTLVRLSIDKKVPSFKVGSQWRYSRAVLEKKMGVSVPRSE